jgi:hypothetical protein
LPVAIDVEFEAADIVELETVELEAAEAFPALPFLEALLSAALVVAAADAVELEATEAFPAFAFFEASPSVALVVAATAEAVSLAMRGQQSVKSCRR